MEQNILIQRAPRSSHHPYLMVSKALIRDKSISVECRWLIIFLLCNTDEFPIEVKQIYAHASEFLGRDKIRALFSEAQEAGYLKEEVFYVNNLKRTRYLLSELAEFKKCFLRPDFQGPEVQAPENQAPLKSNKKKENYKKEEKEREEVPTASQIETTSPPLLKKSYSEKAKEVAKFMIDSIKILNPKAKDPDLEKWSYDLDKMHRLDKKEWDEITDMISWAHNHQFWCQNILSPGKLREKWDTLVIQKNPPMNLGNRIARNRSQAFEAKSCLKNTPKHDIFQILDDKIVNTQTGQSVPFDREPRDFVTEMCLIFKLRKN